MEKTRGVEMAKRDADEALVSSIKSQRSMGLCRGQQAHGSRECYAENRESWIRVAGGCACCGGRGGYDGADLALQSTSDWITDE